MNAARVIPDTEPYRLGEKAKNKEVTNCKKLAVLGPGELVDPDHTNRPERLKECDVIISLNSPLHKHVAQLKAFQKLETLCLWGNMLDADDAAVIVDLLSGSNEIKLDLCNNDLGYWGALTITKLKNIVELDLSRNDIGDSGLRHIGTLDNLTKLTLTNNNIGDDGIEKIADLADHNKITKINISNNKISDCFLNKLIRLNSLEELDLSHNKISNSSINNLKKL